jgi:hypothetical protein
MTLTVETAPGLVRIRVRPRINWLRLCYSLLILVIIAGAGLTPASTRLGAAIRSGSSMGRPILSVLFLLGMAIVNIYAIANMLFASELIALDQTTLEIQKWLFSVSLSERSFPNSTIENLRYEEWGGGRSGMQNGIRFESAGETVTLLDRLATATPETL